MPADHLTGAAFCRGKPATPPTILGRHASDPSTTAATRKDAPLPRPSNQFRDDFVTALAAAAVELTENQHDVLGIMADSLTLSNVAMTDWRRINAGLGRPPSDRRVVRTLAELRQLGWLAGRRWGFDTLAIPAAAGAAA